VRIPEENDPMVATGTELFATGLEVLLDIAKIDPRLSPAAAASF
jgi:hypothetical protein